MTPRILTSLLTLAFLAALPASAQADVRIASATGVTQVNGETVFVDVVVAVPRGQSDRAATDRALAEQGAARREKPPWAGGPGGGGGGGGGGGEEEYFYTGLEWSSFPVVQNYNSLGQPFDASDELTGSQATWTAVPGSDFAFNDGAPTNRCPSLVQQCKGPQVRDGFNDVGWVSIGGSTLGITWSTAANPEADMALNTRFTWKDTCNSTGGSGIDVESVFLHENGHVAGIDHTNVTDSVMFPNYQGPRCTLSGYDQRSLANLYPG